MYRPPPFEQTAQASPSRRERKKQETHQRLLESAWELFQRKGFNDTTVEEVAEAADVAKSTFFNYFSTKEALLDEITLWRIDILGDQVLSTNDLPDSAVARIKRMMLAMLDEFSPNRDLPKQVLLARIGAPIRHESAHRLGSIMHQLVVQGQARGEIRGDVDAGLISRLLMMCAFHHFMHADAAHPPDQGHGVSGPRDVEHTGSPPPPSVDPTVTASGAKQSPQDTGGKSLPNLVDALLDGLGGPRWRNL